MARAKKEAALTPEERLQAALVPDWEWPYKLPENWCWTYFKSISTIQTGKKDANYGSDEGKYPFFTCAAEPIRCHGYSFDCRAILLAGNGDINNISRYNGKFEAYQRTYVVKIAEPLCFDYIFYWFKYRWFDFNKGKMFGTAIPYIRLGNLQEFPTPIPPLSEQHRIVDRIESLFAKMDEAKEKAQAVVDSFETRKAAILHKAFTGELTAKWREENGVSSKEWSTCSLSKCCKIGSGGTPSRKSGKYYAGNIPWIKTGEIEWNEVVDSEEKISQEAIDNSSAKLYDPGAVLVAMYGMGVTRGRASILGVKAATNQAVCVLQPQEYLNNRYLFYFFMCNYWSMREQAVGGNQLNLSATIIGKQNIDIPPVSEQLEIVRILDNLNAKERSTKEIAETVIEQIDTLKKAILARAFRGELGTNDPSEESALELLKKILGEDEVSQATTKKPAKKITIPADIKGLLSNVREEEIIKLLLKSAPQPVSIQEIMSLSSKKFELMDALRSLEKKQLITKNESGEYSLTR